MQPWQIKNHAQTYLPWLQCVFCQQYITATNIVQYVLGIVTTNSFKTRTTNLGFFAFVVPYLLSHVHPTLWWCCFFIIICLCCVYYVLRAQNMIELLYNNHMHRDYFSWIKFFYINLASIALKNIRRKMITVRQWVLEMAVNIVTLFRKCGSILIVKSSVIWCNVWLTSPVISCHLGIYLLAAYVRNAKIKSILWALRSTIHVAWTFVMNSYVSLVVFKVIQTTSCNQWSTVKIHRRLSDISLQEWWYLEETLEES